MKNRGFLLLSLLALVTFSACKLLETDEPADTTGKLGLSDPVTVATSTVSPSGGVISVFKPGDALDGLKIDVKSGSFPSTVTFEIGRSEITSQSFGENFRAISPIVTIKGPKDYAEHGMSLEIPCTVPPGEFAMVFSYNAKEGELEGLPLLKEGTKSVTAWTKHFAHSSIDAEPASAPGKGGVTMVVNDDVERYVVLSMPKAVLMANNVSTSFTVGTDNFEFANRGSVIETSGHCLGQTVATMYYYRVLTLKGSARHLYGRFDNDENTPSTPNVWEDDAAAYRLCSVLQHDEAREYEVDVADYAGEEITTDSLTLMAFKLAMLEDRQPQYLSLRSAVDGHGVLVIGATGTTLQICDPNLPNTQTTLGWTGDHFSAYTANGMNMTRAVFWGRTSQMRWRKIADRWRETLARRIGDGLFPEFIVQARDTTEAPVPLEKGNVWLTRSGQPVFSLSYAGASKLQIDSIFLENGTQVPANNGHWSVPQGENNIGFYVTDEKHEWVGFVWRRINFDPPAPDPDKFEGQGTGILPLAYQNIWQWNRKTFKTDGTLDYESQDFEQINGLSTKGSDSVWTIQSGSDLHQSGSIGGYYVKRGTNILFTLSTLNPARSLYLFPVAVGTTMNEEDYGAKGRCRVVTSISDNVTVKGRTFSCYRYETQYRTSKYGNPLSDDETNNFLKGTNGEIVVQFVSPGSGLIEEQIFRVDFQGTRYLYSDRVIKSFNVR